MKKVLILVLAAMVFGGGCNNAAQPQTTVNANHATQATQKPNVDQTVVSSRSVGETVNPNQTGKNASTESPMAKPVDVSEMTAAIEKAQQEYKKNPNAKDALAKAYFERATALTDAAQYRAALGDYRKGLKLHPNEEEAKKMHDQILAIFKQIGREPPKEGEEPAPMPFNK